MDIEKDRRRFFKAMGTSMLLPLAGCSSFESFGDEQPVTDTTSQDQSDQSSQTDEDPTEATVTIAVEYDEETLQEKQVSLQQKLQNGTINQTQAQQEFQALQLSLLSQAIEKFQSYAQDQSGLQVEDTAPNSGILQATGTPAALIETLSTDMVRGLFPASVFEQAQG